MYRWLKYFTQPVVGEPKSRVSERREGHEEKNEADEKAKERREKSAKAYLLLSAAAASNMASLQKRNESTFSQRWQLALNIFCR